MRRASRVLAAPVVLVKCLEGVGTQAQGCAEPAVLEGRADDAIGMPRTRSSVDAGDAGDARAHLLLCRMQLAEEQRRTGTKRRQRQLRR